MRRKHLWLAAAYARAQAQRFHDAETIATLRKKLRRAAAPTEN